LQICVTPQQLIGGLADDRPGAPQEEPIRVDETQKRLLDWSYSQPPSERLAVQVLDAEGYEDIDPPTRWV
jgi:hypothetical protein